MLFNLFKRVLTIPRIAVLVYHRDRDRETAIPKPRHNLQVVAVLVAVFGPQSRFSFLSELNRDRDRDFNNTATATLTTFINTANDEKVERSLQLNRLNSAG